MLNDLLKLLKYEFRFYFRILVPIYLVLAVLALVLGIHGRTDFYDEGVSTAFVAFWRMMIAFFGIGLTALMVINFILILQRFTDNFFKNPGSLMFTLPVTTWTLVIAKAIAAFCVTLLSAVIVCGSTIIFFLLIRELSGQVIEDYIATLRDPHLQATIVRSVVTSLTLILQQICLIHVVISASHMLPRFRFAAGCALYLVIMIFVVTPVSRNFGYFVSFDVASFDFRAVFINLGFAALFLWLNGFVLKHRFNLD